MTRRRFVPARGLTLIELAVMLVAMGAMITLAVAAIPQLTERLRLDRARDVTLEQLSQTLVEFAAQNGRLPCPDTSPTPNGLEGSGAVSACAAPPADRVGLVPYRVLGFSDPLVGEAGLPIRYAVYRADGLGSSDADLATISNRFIPVLPGDPPTKDFPVLANGTLESEGPPNIISEGLVDAADRKMPATENDLDFCLALRNARAAAATTAQVHTLDLGGATPSFNPAFVIASGGVLDADADAADGAFDGVNEGVGEVDFESPARRTKTVVGDVYDDVVFAMPFVLLESRLNCGTMTIGVSALANVANAAAVMVTQTEDLLWQAERATEMDDIAILVAELSVALAVMQTVQVVADGIMAGFNAACPATIDDAAAIGPIVAAGVAAVGATVLSIVALVLANEQTALNDAGLVAALADAVVTNDIAARVCVDAVNADERGGQGNAPPTPPSPPDRP